MAQQRLAPGSVTVRSILGWIGHPHLRLYKGTGYWYFVFDVPEANVFETHTVYTPRLNDLTIEQWAEEGRSFLKEIDP